VNVARMRPKQRREVDWSGSVALVYAHLLDLFVRAVEVTSIAGLRDRGVADRGVAGWCGHRAPDSGFRTPGTGQRTAGSGFQTADSRQRTPDSEFRILDLERPCAKHGYASSSVGGGQP
jgi:hypothetical protein